MSDSHTQFLWSQVSDRNAPRPPMAQARPATAGGTPPGLDVYQRRRYLL